MTTCRSCGATYPGARCPFCWPDAAGVVASCLLALALCVVLARVVYGQDESPRGPATMVV